ncbi:hypothetical protein GJ689_15975 [Rhodoplanes serenus]|jgi:hypothetical protein|uniref:Uncharacterized protein n=1 Tax=Rhodoplanes serenus TaxID=200615 RepID=A0A327KKG3_9BRAD|nr:hypothetical protein [Rhodoplanes serenus]MBI5114397.1 hypothetical protein [Rhodovulum sp.]MTW17705.1 hypothetical protein [Rhodoplanes serenus]RAI35788.1 hypothetical protein CH340_04885 [Rhodoplanes serenus]VCU09381.1 hypothetical protein RHODGE_RHODGE_02553 [Rhodoplanes serenus]
MRTDDSRQRSSDATCRTCGSAVEVPRFFDTRGHHYCAPECWESVGVAPAHAHSHAHAHSRAPAELR